MLAKVSSLTTESFETNLRESGRTRITYARGISCVHVPFYIPRVLLLCSTHLKTGSFFTETRARACVCVYARASHVVEAFFIYIALLSNLSWLNRFNIIQSVNAMNMQFLIEKF